jgi:hypothetical protein
LPCLSVSSITPQSLSLALPVCGFNYVTIAFVNHYSPCLSVGSITFASVNHYLPRIRYQTLTLLVIHLFFLFTARKAAFDAGDTSVSIDGSTDAADKELPLVGSIMLDSYFSCFFQSRLLLSITLASFNHAWFFQSRSLLSIMICVALATKLLTRYSFLYPSPRLTYFSLCLLSVVRVVYRRHASVLLLAIKLSLFMPSSPYISFLTLPCLLSAVCVVQ